MARASTPFVFLDLYDFDGRTPPAPMELGWHPHSGVATVREPTHGAREEVIGAAAVGAAREAGVEHLIWSTLSDVEKLTDGRLKVIHFSGKAHVDAVVRSAGFARHTFVQAPFYFQTSLTLMAQHPLPGGARAWPGPIDPRKAVIHAGHHRRRKGRRRRLTGAPK